MNPLEEKLACWGDTGTVTVTPCDCDTCTLTTLVVTKQGGRRKRRLEVTLDDENVHTLLAMLLGAQGFNSIKSKQKRTRRK